jgi:membrane fusion protein (multidrug efflux system)
MIDTPSGQRHLHVPAVLPLVLLFAFGLSACGGDPDASDTTPAAASPTSESGRQVRVETRILAPTRFEEVIQLTGTVESSDDATISAQTSGTVQFVRELGSRVAAGDVLVRLDNRLAEAALAQATANLEAAEAAARLAEATYDRQERLYADSILSALEFEDIRARRDQARAALRQAEAAVAQAERQLSYTSITAPFTGRVEAHMINEGETAAPGSPLVRFVSTDRLVVSTGVPERYANDIEVGTPVRMSLRAYGGEDRTAPVSFVSSVIDPSTRTFQIEIEVDNARGTLKPAMIVDVFVTRSVLEDQVVIPQASILRDESGFSVYVVEDGRAVQRAVEPGPSNDGQTVIVSGLRVGDELITSGQTTVTEGDAVAIVPSNS